MLPTPPFSSAKVALFAPWPRLLALTFKLLSLSSPWRPLSGSSVYPRRAQVYPHLSVGKECIGNPGHIIESAYYKRLREVTVDAADATFFFMSLPTNFLYRCPQPGTKTGPSTVKRKAWVKERLKEIVGSLIRDSPHWARRGGADHFWVATHDGGCAFGELSPALRNATCLANSADVRQQFAAKDVALVPNYDDRRAFASEAGPQARSALVLYVGKLFSTELRPTRNVLYDALRGRPGVDITITQRTKTSPRTNMPDDVYYSKLRQSRFCLCPEGAQGWSPRLAEAVWFGCIPVVVADDYVLPLSCFFDWSQFSIVVPEAEAAGVYDLLAKKSDEEVAALQRGLAAVRPFFTGSPLPGETADHFQMALLEMWLKVKVCGRE